MVKSGLGKTVGNCSGLTGFDIRSYSSVDRRDPWVSGAKSFNNLLMFFVVQPAISNRIDDSRFNAFSLLLLLFQMHLVHYNGIYDSVSAAANETQGLAVLGVFIEVC